MILFFLYVAIALLLVAGIWYFCRPHTRYRATFRALREDTKPEYEKYRVHSDHARTALVVGLLLTLSMPAEAVYYGQASRQVNRYWRLDEGIQYKDNFRGEQLPQTVSRVVADGFADLYVEYEGRVCPMSTLAEAYCRSLYGSRTYKDLTATQVLLGWIFYTGDWETRQMTDCSAEARRVRLQFIESVCSAEAMRVLPSESGWQSWTEETDSLGRVHAIVRAIAAGDNALAYEQICALRHFQEQTEVPLPTPLQYRCEQLFSRYYFPLIPAAACGALGLFFFGFFLVVFSRPQRARTPRWLTQSAVVANTLFWLLLTANLFLRSVIETHAPVLEFSERLSVVAWMAMTTGLVLSLAIRRRGLKGALLGALMLVAGLAWVASVRIESTLVVESVSPWYTLGRMLMLWATAMWAMTTLLGLGMWFLSLVCRATEQACVNVYHICHLVLLPALWVMLLGLLVALVGRIAMAWTVWQWSPASVALLTAFVLYAAAVCWHPNHQRTIPVRALRRFFLWQLLCFALLCLGLSAM